MRILIIFIFYIGTLGENARTKLSRIWGPGLRPDIIVMPARYFFVEPRDTNDKKYSNLQRMSQINNTIVTG